MKAGTIIQQVRNAILLLTVTVNTSWACKEETFKRCMEVEVMPFYNQPTILSSFIDIENVRIKYRLYLQDNRDKLLIVLPGKGEPVIKYAETIKDFFDEGYSILAVEHRGQGESDRVLDNTEATYVRYFSNYVLDLGNILDKVFREYRHKQNYLLGHSMGAAIAARFVQQFPLFSIDKLILVSPLIRMNTKPYPYSLARAIVWTENTLGRGRSYAIGEGPFDENYAFEGNTVTSSFERFEWSRNVIRDNPNLRVGGVSNRWVLETVRASEKIIKEARLISIPTLIIQAANDRIVQRDFSEKICKKIPRCSGIIILGAKHEILQEKDDIRNLGLESIKNFLQK